MHVQQHQLPGRAGRRPGPRARQASGTDAAPALQQGLRSGWWGRRHQSPRLLPPCRARRRRVAAWWRGRTACCAAAGCPTARTPRTRCRALAASAGRSRAPANGPGVRRWPGPGLRPWSSARPSSRRRNSSKISRCKASGNAGALSCTSMRWWSPILQRQYHDVPAPAVADGVGDKVLQDAAQQVLVGAHHGAGGHAAQLTPGFRPARQSLPPSTCSSGPSAMSWMCTSNWPDSMREMSSRLPRMASCAARAPSMLSAACHPTLVRQMAAQRSEV